MVVAGRIGDFKSNKNANQSNNAPLVRNNQTKPANNRHSGPMTLSDLPPERSQPQNRIATLNQTSDGEDVNVIPEYRGRPTPMFRFRELLFPYHKLISWTTAIIIVTVCYFAAELIYGGVKFNQAIDPSNRMGGPGVQTLINMGGKWTPYIKEGHIWRLITPIFMHNGILHIAMNLFYLTRFSWLGEARWGPHWFLLVYMWSGIGGVCWSAFIATHTVSTGASGAIFGLMGGHIYFAIRHIKVIRTAVCEIIMLTVMLVINLLIGFLGPSGTDNWAHLGGFVFGVLIVMTFGKIWHNNTPKKTDKIIRLSSGAVLIILTGLSIGLIWIV